jgi:serine/threonine protein kinase
MKLDDLEFPENATVLGKGAYGEVKLARDKTRNETVAVKIIPKNKGNFTTTTKLFTEIEIW